MGSDATSSRDRPLQDRRVAVTRPESGADALTGLLRASGAIVRQYPLTQIEAPADTGPLAAAAAHIADYDWVVFTSANAVSALAAALDAAGVTGGPRHAAVVGSGTAAAVGARLGWTVSALPATHTGDAVVAAMQQVEALRGRRVLWPRAAEALPTISRDLSAAGARLDAPVAYRSVADAAAAAALHAQIRHDALDAITFTAPSAIRSFAIHGSNTGRACVAVIGPTTAAAARAAGLTVHVLPADHTFPGLVAALAEHFRHAADT